MQCACPGQNMWCSYAGSWKENCTMAEWCVPPSLSFRNAQSTNSAFAPLVQSLLTHFLFLQQQNCHRPLSDIEVTLPAVCFLKRTTSFSRENICLVLPEVSSSAGSTTAWNGVQAMLAVLGILAVEFLGKGPWWQAPFTVVPRHTSLHLLFGG